MAAVDPTSEYGPRFHGIQFKRFRDSCQFCSEMCVNARNGGCKNHALILKMIGNQLIRAVAQKQWMLEQPID